MASNLGKLKKVNPRAFWNTEPEFTRWLAQEENLEELSEEIGVNIKTVKVEASVGKFKVDILAEEAGSGEKIVIENQLENANHDHLGKIITYASGYDAKIIIWIVRGAGKEHRRAVEWLNRHSGEETSYFLIKIELWAIGASEPAPKFSILVGPKGWQKALKARPTNKSPGKTHSGSPTKTELKYLDFWNQFKNFVSTKDTRIRLRKPLPQNWYPMTIESPKAHIELKISSMKSFIGCRLCIRKKNKEIFHFFEDRKEEIEKEIGDQSDWVDANDTLYIEIKKTVPDLFSQNKAESHFSWLYKKRILLEKIFNKHFKEFKK